MADQKTFGRLETKITITVSNDSHSVIVSDTSSSETKEHKYRVAVSESMDKGELMDLYDIIGRMLDDGE